MNILYIAVKHVIWRFRICNYFCEISKFRNFMKALRHFAKSVFAQISSKFNYFVKQFILTESPVMYFEMIYIICLYFKGLKFFLEPLRNHFEKIAHKVGKSKYFENESDCSINSLSNHI